MNSKAETYMQRARAALASATLDDFLEFLTVRRFAGGSATARFYDAFPIRKDTKGNQVGGGREELLEQLKAEAAPSDLSDSAPVTAQTVRNLMKLVVDLKDRKPESLDGLIQVALDDFDGYASDEHAPNEIMASLMHAAAWNDLDARTRLGAYYEALMTEYAGTYTALLMALDREPTETVGSIGDLAIVLTALYDGLLIRERLGHGGRDVLARVLLPIIAALTVPVDQPTPTNQDLIFGTPT